MMVPVRSGSAAATPSDVAGTGDLDQVRRDGVLRHLGIPYANFVTGAGDDGTV
mgnify:CR=1 FL=1